MKNEHLVSIIMASYNSEKLIIETINSVLAQTYNNWELLITDDCSDDSTWDIIENFSITDKRILVDRNKINEGAAVSRNNSILKSKGRFIAFLDSDDIWYPKKLEIQLDYMISNNNVFSFSAFDVRNHKKKYLYTKNIPERLVSFNYLLSHNVIGCLTVVYDTSYLGKMLMPDLLRRQDYGLWLKILKKIKFSKGINKPLACYTKSEDSLSSNKFKLLKYNFFIYYKVLNFSFVYSVFLFTKFISLYIYYNFLCNTYRKVYRDNNLNQFFIE